MFIDLQCVERTNSEHNAGQPREIMHIIVKIMRIIVLELCIRLFSLLYVRLPVDAIARAFMIDTNQSIISVWVENGWLHIPSFRVLTP